jgi:hypothetical protein
MTRANRLLPLSSSKNASNVYGFSLPSPPRNNPGVVFSPIGANRPEFPNWVCSLRGVSETVDKLYQGVYLFARREEDLHPVRQQPAQANH